ncbi:hypothetical protein ACS0TY_034340 [Phlomoides rotata]
MANEIQHSMQQISEKVKALAQGPNNKVFKYQSYSLNGVTYHTKERDNTRVVQNSGVTLVSKTMQVASAKDKNPIMSDMTFYGVIDEIWEVDYYNFRIPIFKCIWVDNNNSGIKVDDLGFTLVNLNKIGLKNDSFVLGSLAKQVFYIEDPKDPAWSVVLETPTKEYFEYLNYGELEEPAVHHHCFTTGFAYMAPRKKPKVDRDDHEPRVHRDDHDHEPRVGDDMVTPGLDDTMTHSKRGGTNMYCLYKDRAIEVIKDVDFDKLGWPIGENGTKLQSYIGVLAREKVKITFPTLKHVRKDIKEQIWKAVTLTFNVNPAWKKSCLSLEGSKWRTFKTTLTKEYVYKRIDTPYLNIPSDGSGIDLNVWKDFVRSRLSDKFKQSLLSGDNDLDRATRWLEARKKKDGEFENDELKEITSKIVGFIEKKTVAQNMKLKGKLKSWAAVRTGKVSTSQTSIDVKLVGDVGVKLVDDDDIRLVDEKMGLDNDKKLKGKSVALILESGKNIVAYGTIIKVDDPLVPKNCMCVSIEKVEDKSAILPFPTGDCLTIDDAIGSHVTWPMHLMKLHY